MSNILLIEDDKTQAKVGLKHLKASGHTVKWAQDGKSAIKSASTEDFDIILLDLVLPDMHGNTICQWLKNNERTRLTPIIMLTAKSSVGDMVSGLQAGADDYIEKPYHPEVLGARIQACLRAKALQDELTDKNNELEKLLIDVERLAITDHLTGLFNRRHFNTIMAMEFNSTKRYKTPLCCLMIDLDHFKDINDEFGHQAGDNVLKEFSKILTKTVRNVDIAARWGGEEFIVLMPKINEQESLVAAKRLLKTVSKHKFKGIKGKKITISVGICCIPDSKIKSMDKMVDSADKAMYLAKSNGRNRVEIFK